MAELKVALVGCGRIAQAHARALQNVAGLRLCGVYDVDAGGAARFGRDWHAPAFGDLENLLAMTRPDAAILCAPPLYHPVVATQLLEAGVHILCEKPLAIAPPEADAMAQTARAHDRVLMMASKFRFCDGVRAAREVVSAGTLGDLRQCAVTFCASVDMSGRWNSDPRIAGGGVLMDNGPHALDILRFVLGGSLTEFSPTALRTTLTQGVPLPVESEAQVTLEVIPALRCEVNLSWTAPAPDQMFLSVAGEDATLVVEWKDTWLTDARGERQRVANGYDKDVAFERQLAHFGACVRGVASWQSALDDALWGVRTLEAAYRAARDAESSVPT